MNNHHQDNNNNHGLPFPHSFNIGTTIQNVFRNINHAFARNHDFSGGHQRDRNSRNHTGSNIPSTQPLSFVGGGNDAHTPVTHPSSLPTPAAPGPSISPPTDAVVPLHPQPDLQSDEDEESMPDLRSVSDSTDESGTGLAASNPVPPHRNIQPVDDDRSNARMRDEGDRTPLGPMTGTRRARVDDDGDDARDRRHPSERVGGSPPPGDAVPQNADPQQAPRPPPAGFFNALFGQGPPGGDAPHEHTHTGEATANPLPAGNNPTSGHAPRRAPMLTAGFTLTIPLFGSPPGNRTGPANDGQGGPLNMFGTDAAAREELLASFAAFFHEFQGLDEAWEDLERAKKLVAGLDVVPLGLVKRLECVGGAPGGHVGEPNAEGSSSGCAICLDTLLDPESDSFSGRQFPGDEVPQSEDNAIDGRIEMHTESNVMEVDAPSVTVSHSEPEMSVSNTPSSDAAKIISLPCAHVFHASCLLPWFTRARQATCPTCRFNIDPENLTYTPPRRVFDRRPPAQSDDGVPDPMPADPQTAPDVPLEVPDDTGFHVADVAVPPVDAAQPNADARPSTPPVPPLPAGPAGLGFNPFVAMPGLPMMSFPAIQIPLRPTAAQGLGGANQGTSSSPTALHSRAVSPPSPTNEHPFAPSDIDVVTIGLDMFVGGVLEDRGDPQDDAEGAAGGDGTANPNGFAQDIQSLIEGLLHTTRNIIPQVINAPGPVGAEDGQSQPQARPVPEAAASPPLGGPRVLHIHPLRPSMFPPTHPMAPRRERQTWIVPSAPGPSLRQRVEQREREQGLRCSDTSCGIGPSDDDPYPQSSAPLIKQVSIHSLPEADGLENDIHASICAHAFHPTCLVSAERVAGWGGKDKTEPLVEVSCPVCRAVGCVTREEWEQGVSAL